MSNTVHHIHNRFFQIAFIECASDEMIIQMISLNDNENCSEEVVTRQEARDAYRAYMEIGYSKGMAHQTVNVQPILDRLNHALDHGVKSPKMIVEGFCFKLAKPHSKNPGHVYVTESAEWGSTYFGKIKPSGEFVKSWDAPADTEAKLARISADVVAAAKAYGRQHGRCSFCSRELTHDVSIALSYGPICAEKYGLPHDYSSDAPSAVVAI